jgi:5-formyltetrahydrofolate cyclo-ligase
MQDKAIIRKEILSRRDSIPPAVKKSKDRAIEERLSGLNEFKTANMIFFFASFRSEVDTFGMIRTSLSNGRRVALPKVEGKALRLYEIKNLDELVSGCMNIPEPSVLTDDRNIDINDVDVVIIPGAAFDETGNRMGYGGGFYDKLLAGLEKSIPIIAPTYEEQVIESVPVDSHDKKVGIIVTDRRVIRCS